MADKVALLVQNRHESCSVKVHVYFTYSQFDLVEWKSYVIGPCSSEVVSYDGGRSFKFDIYAISEGTLRSKVYAARVLQEQSLRVDIHQDLTTSETPITDDDSDLCAQQQVALKKQNLEEWFDGLNLYAVLELDKEALWQLDETEQLSQIRSSYRKLIRRYHPDRHDGDHSIAVRIIEAYATLSNPSTKKAYDRRLKNGWSQLFSGHYWSQLLEDCQSADLSWWQQAGLSVVSTSAGIAVVCLSSGSAPIVVLGHVVGTASAGGGILSCPSLWQVRTERSGIEWSSYLKKFGFVFLAGALTGCATSVAELVSLSFSSVASGACAGSTFNIAAVLSSAESASDDVSVTSLTNVAVQGLVAGAAAGAVGGAFGTLFAKHIADETASGTAVLIRNIGNKSMRAVCNALSHSIVSEAVSAVEERCDQNKAQEPLDLYVQEKAKSAMQHAVASVPSRVVLGFVMKAAEECSNTVHASFTHDQATGAHNVNTRGHDAVIDSPANATSGEAEPGSLKEVPEHFADNSPHTIGSEPNMRVEALHTKGMFSQLYQLQSANFLLRNTIAHADTNASAAHMGETVADTQHSTSSNALKMDDTNNDTDLVHDQATDARIADTREHNAGVENQHSKGMFPPRDQPKSANSSRQRKVTTSSTGANTSDTDEILADTQQLSSSNAVRVDDTTNVSLHGKRTFIRQALDFFEELIIGGANPGSDKLLTRDVEQEPLPVQSDDAYLGLRADGVWGEVYLHARYTVSGSCFEAHVTGVETLAVPAAAHDIEVWFEVTCRSLKSGFSIAQHEVCGFQDGSWQPKTREQPFKYAAPLSRTFWIKSLHNLSIWVDKILDERYQPVSGTQ